jgi:beta-xylosidase
MYYSAEEHICADRGKSPLGPFVQQEKRTMLDEGKNIDHTLFRDDDGRPYIFFVRFQGGNIIWSGELEASLDKIKPGTMKRCIGPEQPWEKVRANVNEGAALLKHQGKYYLTYSGNDYQSQQYGIGYAVADSLEGPWKKAEENPILQSPGDLVGVGHHAFFRDKEGRLMAAFHAHNSRTAVHPRLMHIATAYFQDGRLVISPDYFTPSLEE